MKSKRQLSFVSKIFIKRRWQRQVPATGRVPQPIALVSEIPGDE